MVSSLPGSLPSYIHFILSTICIFLWLIEIVIVVYNYNITGNVCWLCTEWPSGGNERELTEDTDNIVRPNNTVVVVGSRLVIPCTANVDNESRWDYYPYLSHALSSIYNGDKVSTLLYTVYFTVVL